MRSLSSISDELNLNYEIRPINTPLVNTLFNVSSYPFSLKISEVLFHLCLNNYRSPLLFKNYNNELEFINDMLTVYNLSHISLDDISHLCSSSTTVPINDNSLLIPFIISSIYPDLFDCPTDAYINSHQPTVHNIDRLHNVITIIINDSNIIPNTCSYYDSLIQHLKISQNHIIGFQTHIHTSFITLTPRIPLLYISTNDKRYIAEIRFMSQHQYNQYINEEDSLRETNAKLHLYTRSDNLVSPDDFKLIAIFPYQSTYIKFHHDPMITQLDL